MWEKEIKAAIQAKRPVMIRLRDNEVLQGIPTSCTDHLLKLRRHDGVVWIPTEDIKRANQFVRLN